MTNNPVNELENFDAAYRKQIEFRKELEKIEIAYVRTVEKYGEFEDCRMFAGYLRTIEKIFKEAKFNEWDAERNKDELIKAKISAIAQEHSLSEDIFVSIYEDFKKSGATVSKIFSTTNELLEKYGKDSECGEFILYLQYLYTNFHEADESRLSRDELKDRLVHARMEVLSSDGNPELSMLEKIYREFKDLVK